MESCSLVFFLDIHAIETMTSRLLEPKSKDTFSSFAIWSRRAENVLTELFRSFVRDLTAENGKQTFVSGAYGSQILLRQILLALNNFQLN